MAYLLKENYSIVKKHIIFLIIFYVKALFFLLIWIFIGFIWINFKDAIWDEMVKYIFFPLIFILINYSFFKLIFATIEYYNSLFIIRDDQIFIVNATLIMRNDIEVVDSFKIVKLDAYSRWVFSNMLWFWQIIIETQTKEEREFLFMPKPYKLLEILKKQRDIVLEERKKKYIIDDVVVDNNKKS